MRYITTPSNVNSLLATGSLFFLNKFIQQHTPYTLLLQDNLCACPVTQVRSATETHPA